MSSHEKIPFELNLLLKQQDVKEIENRFEIKYESFRVETYEEIEEQNPECLANEKTNLALTLTKWQIEENSFYLKYKSIWDEYKLLRQNLECIYHYFTCIKLTAKATKEMADMITNLGIRESTELFQEIQNDNFEQEVLEVIHNNEIKTSWDKFEQCKKNYNIATKNFKILLEIMDFTFDDLYKLKKQFDDVFLEYQHAKSEVKQLPDFLEKMKVIFHNCLHLLGGNVVEFIKCTTSLCDLIKNPSDQFVENKE